MDIKFAVYMDTNGKDTKHTRHIDRRINLVRNGENYKMNRIDWCEGGLQLSDIATKNVDENDINPRIKYIMARLDNWYGTLVQEGWQNKRYSIEQYICMPRLYLFEYLTQSVWNGCKENWRLYVLKDNNVVLNGKQCREKNM